MNENWEIPQRSKHSSNYDEGQDKGELPGLNPSSIFGKQYP